MMDTFDLFRQLRYEHHIANTTSTRLYTNRIRMMGVDRVPV